MALRAGTIDCAVAFERANKHFYYLESRDLYKQQKKLDKIVNTKALTHVADLERLRREIEAFIMQAERAVSDLKPKAKLSKRSKSNAESQHDTH